MDKDTRKELIQRLNKPIIEHSEWKEMIDAIRLDSEIKKLNESLEMKKIEAAPVLIANPKHKGVMCDAFYKMHTLAYVIWTQAADDDKIFQVTDADLIKHIKANVQPIGRL